MPRRAKPTPPASPEPRPAPAPIPDDQWDLPVSFNTAGELVTLREYAHPRTPVFSPAQLSGEQRARVTAERIARKPHFEVGMLGVGILNKERAVVEVRGQSVAGKVLIEIEFRLIQNLMRQAGVP